jgi:hypothetical protein
MIRNIKRMVHLKKEELAYLRSVEKEYEKLQERVRELEGYVQRRRELTILSQDKNKAKQLGVSLEEYQLNKPKRGRPKKEI